MFKRILIAEDHEIRNLGVIKTLEELNIRDFEFVSYCDDAFTKIKRAVSDNFPYDLLITDLSFDGDYREQNLKSGQELIAAAKDFQPELKIIAFSIEKKPSVIDELFKKYEIDGFVSKGRNDGKELKNTIRKVYENQIVIPREIKTAIKRNTFEFSDYDILLLNLLAKGLKQQEIENHLKENQIKPDSRSSIEKRLNDLRETLGAKNNVEMIALCKDLGII